MRQRTRPIVALILALAAACAAPQERHETPPTADSLTVARARDAAAALGPDLMGLLLSQLDRGGPEAALTVCVDSAQVRTARHSVDGVAIRRIGTRVRNPVNAPDSIETRLLAYLTAELDAGRLPAEFTEVARTGAGGAWELRYLRPIVLLDRCTACHGAEAEIAPGVRTLIAARYPADAAVNYRPGELRGAISVRVPLPATQ